jgi:hypothetical protein
MLLVFLWAIMPARKRQDQWVIALKFAECALFRVRGQCA